MCPMLTYVRTARDVVLSLLISVVCLAALILMAIMLVYPPLIVGNDGPCDAFWGWEREECLAYEAQQDAREARWSR